MIVGLLLIAIGLWGLADTNMDDVAGVVSELFVVGIGLALLQW